ncbi:hypothetical protein IFM89_025730 [Coptis chinensis]|uniref:Uncharacterized protein n=1 Tax=Coptis chinensis TaxID=261450 RepID=A0A835I3G6_9MAGN|nr:hypothetical protein IFM89_025730 [Coptis chinensis]
MVLSSIDPKRGTIVAIIGGTRNLVFCRPGRDNAWYSLKGVATPGISAFAEPFLNITVFNDIFYVVDKLGQVYYVHGLNGLDPCTKFLINAPPFESFYHKHYR